MKFLLEDPRESISLCGCKLSTRAPFCDGETCLKIWNNEEIVPPQLVEEQQPVVETTASNTDK